MGALNDRKVRTTQPPAKGTKPLLLVDGAGLYLRVFPSGTKTWLTKYEHAGRQVQISLGNYPAMSLAQARTAREAVRGAVREKRSPRHEQIAARDANPSRRRKGPSSGRRGAGTLSGRRAGQPSMRRRSCKASSGTCSR
jgi:hypothetical protein